MLTSYERCLLIVGSRRPVELLRCSVCHSHHLGWGHDAEFLRDSLIRFSNICLIGSGCLALLTVDAFSIFLTPSLVTITAQTHCWFTFVSLQIIIFRAWGRSSSIDQCSRPQIPCSLSQRFSALKMAFSEVEPKRYSRQIGQHWCWVGKTTELFGRASYTNLEFLVQC